MDPVYVIKKPVLTEKSAFAQEGANVYTFEVDRRASKDEIKGAVERAYGVHVEKVNTQLRKGKRRRLKYGYVLERPSKKATVRLKDGDTIDLF